MKLVRFLFSTRLTAILFIVFCVAMAVGTFVESIHNTATARIWVYNAWWFEAIMGVFVLNFIGNIKNTVFCDGKNGQFFFYMAHGF